MSNRIKTTSKREQLEALENFHDMNGTDDFSQLDENSRTWKNDSGDILKIFNGKPRRLDNALAAIFQDSMAALWHDEDSGLVFYLETFTDSRDESRVVVKAVEATLVTIDDVKGWVPASRDNGVVVGVYRLTDEYIVGDTDDGKAVFRLPKGWHWTSKMPQNLATIHANTANRFCIKPILKGVSRQFEKYNGTIPTE